MNIVLSIFSKSSANLFVIVYSSSVLPGLVPWFVILLSELRFRRQNAHMLEEHPFKMPFYPLSNYLAIMVELVELGFRRIMGNRKAFSPNIAPVP